MEGSSRNGEISPKLLHLIPQGRRNWFHHEKASVYNTEEKNLELKLGPPGEDEDEYGSSLIRRIKKEQKDKSILSLAGNHHFSPSITTNKPTSQKRFKTIFTFYLALLILRLLFLFLSVLYPFDMMTFT